LSYAIILLRLRESNPLSRGYEPLMMSAEMLIDISVSLCHDKN
jgi:hypothetical protein